MYDNHSPNLFYIHDKPTLMVEMIGGLWVDHFSCILTIKANLILITTVTVCLKLSEFSYIYNY